MTNEKYSRKNERTIWSDSASTFALVWLNMAVSRVVKNSLTRSKYWMRMAHPTADACGHANSATIRVISLLKMFFWIIETQWTYYLPGLLVPLRLNDTRSRTLIHSFVKNIYIWNKKSYGFLNNAYFLPTIFAILGTVRHSRLTSACITWCVFAF